MFSFLKYSINYPSPPYLEYKYPIANKTIIENISRALYNVPKFYEQVLHLMNKMNLPVPFEGSFPSDIFPDPVKNLYIFLFNSYYFIFHFLF